MHLFESLSLSLSLISKIFVRFIMNVTSADGQTFVLDVASSAASADTGAAAATCWSLIRTLLERHLRCWVTLYTMIMNKPRVQIAPISAPCGALGNRPDSGAFYRKRLLILWCDGPDLPHVWQLTDGKC